MKAFLNLFYRFYPLAIAAVLAAGAVWLEHATRSPETPDAPTVSQTPDFIAQTVRITGFAQDGSLNYTLDSPHIQHLPATDQTHADQPRLMLINQGRHMRINADHGEVAPKAERVDFAGNVEAEREGAPAEPPMHLSSARLTVWPNEQRAASDVPVRITQGGNRSDASSMAADNVFGVMKLSGKAKMRIASRYKRNS
ncbi:MAG: LPS export ABC transporter periplasmic protein LptC [Azoarcus sp.]|jgi:lipopolysaccharide export system protein LptC|nr:LPS export ABC transporter periplasmic protein LptC [Azoarcus sp.]